MSNASVQVRLRAMRAKAGALAQLNAATHANYLAALARYTDASQAEASALLNVAAAIASNNQADINNAINTALIAESNALTAGIDCATAASADATFQATYVAAQIKSSLLPAGGYWNAATPPQYGLSADAYQALAGGKVIYDYYPGSPGKVAARATLNFSNNYYKANPTATLAQINAYGAQLREAAQSSDSFGSFLMGALPYIAIVAAVATGVVFLSGAVAAAGASSVEIPAAAAIAPETATAAGLAPLSASELAATTAANEAAAAATAAGLAPLSASELAITQAGNMVASSAASVVSGVVGSVETVATGKVAQEVIQAVSPAKPAATVAAPAPAASTPSGSVLPWVIGLGLLAKFVIFT